MSKKSSSTLFTILGVVLVTVLFLEVALQILAFVVSRKGSGDTAGAEGEKRTVVCLGDSYTYGVGASTPHETSYPSRLEARLNDRSDGPWRVVNSGWPGRDSRGVLEVLDYHLLVEKPEILVVLIGINDTWGHPDLLTLPPLAEAQAEHGDGSSATKGKFRLEFRTLRLLKTLRGKNLFRDEADAPAMTSPAETQGISPEGAAPEKEFVSPLLEPFKKVEGITIYPHEPEPTEPAAIEVFRADPKALGEVWEYLNDSKLVEAEASALRLSDKCEHYRINVLAQIYGKMGKRDLEAAQLEHAFEMAKRTDLSLAEAENITQVFHTLNAFEAALPTLADFQKQFPESVVVNQYYMQFLAALGQLDEAAAIGRKLIPLHEMRGNEHWGAIGCYRTYSKVEKNPKEAMTAIYKVYGMNAEKEEVIDNIKVVMMGNKSVDRAVCEEALAEMPFTEVAKAELAAAVEAVFSGNLQQGAEKKADLEVMKNHLGQIVQRCDDLGIKVLFHTYPFFAGDVMEAQKGAAQGKDAEFMNTHQLFSEKVEASGRPREEFFIADGHCNDDGYDIMAGLVYDALGSWLERE